MNKYSLNRIDGEELEKVIVDTIRELNSGEENNSCYSTIQTNIQMKGYFVTQSDLGKTLREMEKDRRVTFISPKRGIFSDGNYELNPAPSGVAN